MPHTLSNSWEIIAHNTIIWTGDVKIDYIVVLIIVVALVVRTKL